MDMIRVGGRLQLQLPLALALTCAVAGSVVADAAVSLLQAEVRSAWAPGQGPGQGPKWRLGNTEVVQLEVGDEPEAWRKAGFAVAEDGLCEIGSVRVHLVGGGTRGVLGIALKNKEHPKAGSMLASGIRINSTSSADPMRLGDNPNKARGVMKVLWKTQNYMNTYEVLEQVAPPEQEFSGKAYWYGTNVEYLELIGPESGLIKPFIGRDFMELWVVVPDQDSVVSAAGEENLKDIKYYGERLMVTLDTEKLNISVPISFLVPGQDTRATNGFDGHGAEEAPDSAAKWHAMGHRR